jgi:predicted DNA-binding protein (UPF0251 family)
MSRPQKERIVHQPPLFADFKPIGVKMNLLKQVSLSLDEYEAFRLADYMGLSQDEAANEMEISRSTFTRLIEKARSNIAQLIVNGSALNIDGGNIHFRKNIIRCNNCGHMFNINIDKSISNCPECNSTNLLNIAGGFGHGKCCST